MENEQQIDTGRKKRELALIQISIGVAGDRLMENWLDLELTVKKTKRLLATLLGLKASHVEILTRTKKGQDTDILREALGESRELTVVLMDESESGSENPPSLVSESSEEEVRTAAQFGAEEFSASPGEYEKSSEVSRLNRSGMVSTDPPPEVFFLEGTRVTVRFASGRVVTQRLVHAQTEQEVYMMGMLGYFVGYFRLPEQCLQIAWRMEEPLYCEATLIPLPVGEYGALDYGNDCCICCGAEDDNTEVLRARSRAMNCNRCGPDVLCTQCRFLLPGRAVCMYCLREDELSLISPRQLFRWRCLVGPEPAIT